MKPVIVAAFMLGLCGCALNQPREFDPDLCEKGAAYEAGYNDGQKPWRSMDSSFLNRCREDLRDSARTSYQDGYNKGHAEAVARQQEYQRQQALQRQMQLQQQQQAEDGPAQININIGGGADNPHRWYCKVHAFMTDFEGFGPTQFEARRDAKRACMVQYHEMHCEDANCEIVR